MKENKGITLIALVVTIVILIILASVSISVLLGDNGLIQRARQATLHSNKASKLETIQMDIMEEQIDGSGTITMGSLVSILNRYGTIEYNEDGSIKGVTTEDGIFISLDEIIKTEKINTKANSVYAKLYSFNDGSGDLLELSSTDYTDTADNITLKQDYGNIGNTLYYYDWEKSKTTTETGDNGGTISTHEDQGNFTPWVSKITTTQEYGINKNIIKKYNNDKIIEVKIIDEIRPIYLSNWFYGCSTLQKITNCNNIKTGDTARMDFMFYNCKSLISIDVSEWVTSKVTDMRHVFYNCTSLTSIDVSRWDISNVTDMRDMFANCLKLTSVDVSNWDTSNVINMYSVFGGCSNLISIDVSNWNTSNVTDMGFMFAMCLSLTSLDVDNWNTSKMTDMSGMFYNCAKLTSIDVSNWNTSNVTNMSAMFSSCTGLTSIDVGKWDTSNVTDMYAVFYKCSNLTNIDLSNWNTSKVTDMYSMFENCSALKTITVGDNWVKVEGCDTTNMFKNCGTTVNFK